MKVKTLIETLQKFDPESPVAIFDNYSSAASINFCIEVAYKTYGEESDKPFFSIGSPTTASIFTYVAIQTDTRRNQ